MAKMPQQREKCKKIRMDRISQASDNYGVTSSTKKIKTVHQSAPGKSYSVKGQKLQVVDKVMYLRNTLSRSKQNDCLYQCSIWQATEKGLGSKWNYMHTRYGHFTSVKLKYLTSPSASENFCRSVAKRDPRHSSDRLAISLEFLMNAYQRKSSVQTFRWETPLLVIRENVTRIS